MNKKIKIDQYMINEKGRTYEILKFPFIKYMWAFDDDPEEYMLMVDGCKDAFMWMKYAFAILANYPNKIIYFPCKQSAINGYYNDNYHLVLCRPEVQLRRSLWTRIKKKINQKHIIEKFVLQYDRKKLDDYYEKGLREKQPVEIPLCKDRKQLLNYKPQKGYHTHTEEIIGDTIFIVLNRVECFDYHYNTAKDLDDYSSNSDYPIWSSIGYIISDKQIKDMVKKEEDSNKQKR